MRGAERRRLGLRLRRVGWATCVPLAVALGSASAARAQELEGDVGLDELTPAAEADVWFVDRVAVRWTASELGGAAAPRQITERTLALEARLEALAEDGGVDSSEAFTLRHLHAALERHVAEELLAARAIVPPPSAAEIRGLIVAARLQLEQRGGADAVAAALRAEGVSTSELDVLLRRRALASLYLHRMVAPMLDPSRAELRATFRSGSHPYRGAQFERVEPALRRWLVARRLRAALGRFFDGVRGRVEIVVLG